MDPRTPRTPPRRGLACPASQLCLPVSAWLHLPSGPAAAGSSSQPSWGKLASFLAAPAKGQDWALVEAKPGRMGIPEPITTATETQGEEWDQPNQAPGLSEAVLTRRQERKPPGGCPPSTAWLHEPTPQSHSYSAPTANGLRVSLVPS